MHYVDLFDCPEDELKRVISAVKHVADLYRQKLGIEQALGSEPSPEVAADLAETCQSMMDQLSDEMLQRVAQLKLEGYSNREISEQLGCVERTVERKLERIRSEWADYNDAKQV